MKVIGASSSLRQGARIHGRCADCGEHARVSFRSFRYYHVLGVPVVLLGTSDGVICTHCAQVEHGKTLDLATRQRVRDTNRGNRRPRWHFMGATAVAGVIAFNVALGGAEVQSAPAASAGELCYVSAR